MIVFLNGDYLPLEAARISPLDRGFLFGDGVYEVIPVYSRRCFRLDEHLARLRSSLAAIRLDDPYSPADWQRHLLGLLERNEGDDLSLYLQVTRGADSFRDQAFPAAGKVAPTIFMFAAPLLPPPADLVQHGASAITAVDNRWLRCDIKSVSLLANVLLRQQSCDVGATETIMLRDGWLTEGSASSIFVVKDGVLRVPPKGPLILPGITYDVVLELAAANGIQCAVQPVSEAELRSAEEIWLASSTKEVLPITRLDGQAVGTGQPGPLGRRMMALYQDYKQTVMRRP